MQQPTSGRSTAGAAPVGRTPAGRSTTRCQQPARKGLLTHGRPKGQRLLATSPQRGAACGHDTGRRGGCQRARAAVACAGAAAATTAAKGGKRTRASF
ncbi:hypothetical protein BHE74_00020691 [Ensete ventricosum]|nr:hypothetical protein BHE74_00020691 [Ensete ventricosum]